MADRLADRLVYVPTQSTIWTGLLDSVKEWTRTHDALSTARHSTPHTAHHVPTQQPNKPNQSKEHDRIIVVPAPDLNRKHDAPPPGTQPKNGVVIQSTDRVVHVPIPCSVQEWKRKYDSGIISRQRNRQEWYTARRILRKHKLLPPSNYGKVKRLTRQQQQERRSRYERQWRDRMLRPTHAIMNDLQKAKCR